MNYLGKSWKKITKRPALGSQCLIVEDAEKTVLNVVAHSSFDKTSFFADSENWKGVFNARSAHFVVYIEEVAS